MGVGVVQEIEASRARVMADGGVAELLDAAWDALGVLLAWSRACEERAGQLFAAFAFAAASAAEGQMIVASAPSLAGGRSGDSSHDAIVQDDLEKVADALSGLAGALRDRLRSGGLAAADPGDRAACEHAAVPAAQICALLSQDGR
jgi:hypothetical protein